MLQEFIDLLGILVEERIKVFLRELLDAHRALRNYGRAPGRAVDHAHLAEIVSGLEECHPELFLFSVIGVNADVSLNKPEESVARVALFDDHFVTSESLLNNAHTEVPLSQVDFLKHFYYNMPAVSLYITKRVQAPSDLRVI